MPMIVKKPSICTSGLEPPSKKEMRRRCRRRCPNSKNCSSSSKVDIRSMPAESARALQCPVCRARFRGSRYCSRCGADLADLMRIAARAWRLRNQARRAIRCGDWHNAAALAYDAAVEFKTPQGEALRLIGEWMAGG